jgi:hypothetical protein
VDAKQKQKPKYFSRILKMHHTNIKIAKETVCPKTQALGHKIRTFI